jgi:lysophospholipase L1-like esterase
MLIRRIAERCALVLFGLVLGLLLVEGGLRLGAFVTSRYYALASPGSSDGRVRILTLGDSNTFGLYVGRLQAYPHLLEAQWNARTGNRPIEVLNGGYPGNSSWSVLARLGDLLAKYRPDIVTIMVGANDAWREPEPRAAMPIEACVERARAGVVAPDVPRVGGWRLMRALKLLESWLPMPVEDLPLINKWRPTRPQFDPAWSSDLVANLHFIAACAERTGAQVVFLTYPGSGVLYDVANDAMRVSALQASLPWIDLAQRFAPRCRKSKCEYLYPDQHPTRAGHAWIAEILVDGLPAAVPSLAPEEGGPAKPGA